ncbi:MAG: valine--tRNA ligase [Acidobacteriota bacterium]
MEIEKEYLPEKFEKKWYSFWIEKEFFKADPLSEREPFCIVIPPPNITGTLHVGHALNYTLQDIVVRWKRMSGYDVLWLPGYDHAGIATQIVVERELQKEGTARQMLGRQKFEERVWEWKKQYSEKIIETLKRLGSSCDWSRTRFTLDPMLSRAVREVFVRLYREGLIYRDKYIVNWCPRCKTALSDLEVVHGEIQGKLYYILYPLKGKKAHVTVATTRPETMLGDTAVAVNPSDKRYEKLLGQTIILPIMEREIPIIADHFVDPEFGTGAVKVTPAHDFNDFAVSKRLKLPLIVVIDEEGKMNENAGEFKSLDRYKCRKLIVERLRREKLLSDVKNYTYSIGKCQRCNTVVEPLVSTQWFMKMETLAAPAITVVDEGRIRFIPDIWKKTYFEWMRNIHDWCISRQLWWGHRIPAWYCSCGEIMVDVKEPAACSRCENKELKQDEDVLDTWFSSALWPFSAMGWPEQTTDLKRYYPTTTLITGFDIIFFWVARMIMMGLKFGGDVPFRGVYYNGLIRDEKGHKMSKSKGNVIDTEEIMLQYGTDAVRFTLAILAAPGMDIPLAPERMAGYRAFANKLWNATRFVLGSLPEGSIKLTYDLKDLILVDRWILSAVNKLVGDVNRTLGSYRFDQAANQLYHFLWHQFCDWYIELVKPSLLMGDEKRKEVSMAVLVEVLDKVLRLLHPFMPFLTEELWQKIPHQGDSITVAPYPVAQEECFDEKAEGEMAILMELITRIRNLRAENNIDPSRKIELIIRSDKRKRLKLAADNEAHIMNLTRSTKVQITEDPLPEEFHARCVASGFEVAIPLKGIIDTSREKNRIEREITKLDKEIGNKNKKLSNEAFLSNAPKDIVEKEKQIHRELLEKKKKLLKNLTLITKAGK